MSIETVLQTASPGEKAVVHSSPSSALSASKVFATVAAASFASASAFSRPTLASSAPKRAPSDISEATLPLGLH